MRSVAFGRTAAAPLLMLLTACGIQAAPEPPIANFEASLVGLETPFAAGNVVDCLAKSLTEQTQCRDTIVQALMIAIDLRYAQFENGFFDANRYAGFGATLAILGLSSAGAVVSGGTSQLLSAAAAGVTGAREAYKREVLLEQAAPALLTAMNAQRDNINARIREGLKLPATGYSLGVALTDVYAYYRAGTVVGALTGVTKAVGEQHQEAQRRLEESVVAPQPAPVNVVPAPQPPHVQQPAPSGGGTAIKKTTTNGGRPKPPVPSACDPPADPTVVTRKQDLKVFVFNLAQKAKKEQVALDQLNFIYKTLGVPNITSTAPVVRGNQIINFVQDNICSTQQMNTVSSELSGVRTKPF